MPKRTGREQPQRDFLQSIVDTVRDPVLVLDGSLRVVATNRAFRRAFDVSPRTAGGAEGTLVYELGDGQWDIPALRLLLEDILPRDSSFDGFEVEHDFPGLGRRVMLLNARKLYRPVHARRDGGETEMILLAFEDVTERRRTEAELRDAAERLRLTYEALSDAYDREHKIAQALQRPMLLGVPEDAFPGLAVATFYEAASPEAEIGGDFFDAFALPHDRVVLAVGDASGKGLEAAGRTMQAKDVLRAFAREYPHVAAAIASRLSDYIYNNKRFEPKRGPGGPLGESFVTLALAIMHPPTGETTVLAAGAETPIVLRADGRHEMVPPSGLPLGVSEQQLYTTTVIWLEPGDTLLLLTDGITDARRPPSVASPGGDFLGHEGFIRLARRAQTAAGAAGAGAQTLGAMGRSILDGARAFGGGTLRDDACLLLARRR